MLPPSEPAKPGRSFRLWREVNKELPAGLHGLAAAAGLFHTLAAAILLDMHGPHRNPASDFAIRLNALLNERGLHWRLSRLAIAGFPIRKVSPVEFATMLAAIVAIGGAVQLMGRKRQAPSNKILGHG